MTADTYVHLDPGVEEEGFARRMFEGRVSVELEDSSVPLDAIKRNIVHFITTVKLCTLPSSYNFRVYRQREIL